MRGLEPPWVAPHDPKSCASASSATSAICGINYQDYNGNIPSWELYESRLEKSILFGLFPICNNTLREIYFGRDFDLCSEGVMKCPGG